LGRRRACLLAPARRLRDQLPEGATAEAYTLTLSGEPRRAVALWRKIGCPYEAALALADDDDESALREALDELYALDARPAATVARRLRERGVRGLPRGPRPGTRENLAGLTARELEVLELLAEGLRSNRTVDHRVAAILRRLDVRTRGEASAQALSLGLTA
jgi:DNA-binding NarL/FixJ family response regulator